MTNGTKICDFPMVDDSYVIVERLSSRVGTPSDVGNGDALRRAYAEAVALTPGGNALATRNRAAVILPPGRYDMGLGATVEVAGADEDNHGLILDTEFVDLIGLTGKKEDVVITSQIATASRGTVEQPADDVEIRGVTLDIDSAAFVLTHTATDPAAYFPEDSLGITARLVDVECTTQAIGNAWSMRIGIEYSGTFIGCTGGTDSFGTAGTASGTFTGCVGGNGSFGGSSFAGLGTASGTFTGCVGGNGSFGGGSTASGTFTDCAGGVDSFGGGGTASGAFTNCVGGNGSWNGNSDSGLTAVLRRCRSIARTEPITHWQGLMIGCEFENIGTDENCVEVATTGVARFYNNILLTDGGSGNAIWAAAAEDAIVGGLITNATTPLHANVTNLVGDFLDADALVIGDADVSF